MSDIDQRSYLIGLTDAIIRQDKEKHSLVMEKVSLTATLKVKEKEIDKLTDMLMRSIDFIDRPHSAKRSYYYLPEDIKSWYAANKDKLKDANSDDNGHRLDGN